MPNFPCTLTRNITSHKSKQFGSAARCWTPTWVKIVNVLRTLKALFNTQSPSTKIFQRVKSSYMTEKAINSCKTSRPWTKSWQTLIVSDVLINQMMRMTWHDRFNQHCIISFNRYMTMANGNVRMKQRKWFSLTREVLHQQKSTFCWISFWGLDVASASSPSQVPTSTTWTWCLGSSITQPKGTWPWWTGS